MDQQEGPIVQTILHLRTLEFVPKIICRSIPLPRSPGPDAAVDGIVLVLAVAVAGELIEEGILYDSGGESTVIIIQYLYSSLVQVVSQCPGSVCEIRRRSVRTA